jgi:hypothetical protein
MMETAGIAHEAMTYQVYTSLGPNDLLLFAEPKDPGWLGGRDRMPKHLWPGPSASRIPAGHAGGLFFCFCWWR